MQDETERITAKEALAALGMFAAVLMLALAVGLRDDDGAILGAATTDLAAMMYHLRAYAFESIARGVLPLWNPHTYCGTPFAANPETAIFYPLNWIFLVLPLAWAVNASIAIHLIGGAMGTWLFARSIRIDRMPAIYAGIAWMLCGQMFGRIYAGHLSMICTFVWFPILLYWCERLLVRPSRQAIGLAAICYGCSILAGHIQIMFYMSAMMAVYLVVRACMDRSLWKRFFAILAFATLGAGIAMIQLSISFFAARESSRAALSLEAGSTFALPLQSLAGYVLPWFYGNNLKSPYWGPWYFWEIAVYVGAATLPLAAAGIFTAFTRERKSAPIIALSVTTLLALMFSLGVSTTLFPILFDWVPGFGNFRGPAKALVLVSCLLAILAAFGLGELVKGNRRAIFAALGGVGFCVSALILLYVSTSAEFVRASIPRWGSLGAALDFRPELFDYPQVMDAVMKNARNGFIASLIALCVCGICIAAFLRREWSTYAATAFVAFAGGDLMYIHAGQVARFSSPPEQVAEGVPTDDYRYIVVNPAISPNRAMSEGWLSVTGYEPLYPRRFGEFMNMVNREPVGTYDQLPEPRNFDDVLAKSALRFRTGESEEIADLDFVPRVGVYTDWANSDSPEETERLFRADPKPLVIEEKFPPRAGNADPGSAKILSATPNKLGIEVHAPPHSVLYLADSFSPGWSAWDEMGRGYVVFPANHAFRGIYLEKGYDGVIAFRYRAPGFRLGLVITILSLLAALGAVFWPRRKTPVAVS